MPKTLPMIEARKQLTSLPEQFEREGDADVVAVTRRGKPVLAVMPWEFYEALTETLEVMSDDTLMGNLRQSIGELKAGKTIPWEEAKRELGR
ncbi:MAG: type II toxin-antitoxin system Phd/YefM family antitoxin [Syntrophales bacterium]